MTDTPQRKSGGYRRTERKRAERIAQLERIAAKTFAEHGYNGTNLDLVAAALDLRGASLYNYVSSKEDLLLRCVNSAADAVYSRILEIDASDLPPVEKLYALFHAQILIEVRDFPEYVPLFFKTEVPVESVRNRILEVRREHAVLYERVAEQYRTETGAARNAVRVWLEIAYGALAYLPEWYRPDGALGCEELADAMADALVAPFRAAALH